jgi:cytochrome c biogenesis protein CcmG/thiol:disulfide interchange protein DsbE
VIPPRRRLVAGGALAVLLAASSQAGSSAAGPSPNGSAPDFTRADLSGKPIHLGDYRGKVVLLNFWATWCAPCLAEIPTFVHWQEQYGASGLQVLGVSMDDDAKPVKRFLQKQALAYPVVMGDVPLGQLYGGVLGLPLTYLIDLQGQIVGRYQGETNLTAIESQIKALLPRRKN